MSPSKFTYVENEFECEGVLKDGTRNRLHVIITDPPTIAAFQSWVDSEKKGSLWYEAYKRFVGIKSPDRMILQLMWDETQRMHLTPKFYKAVKPSISMSSTTESKDMTNSEKTTLCTPCEMHEIYNKVTDTVNPSRMKFKFRFLESLSGRMDVMAFVTRILVL
jgi:hypothetical protein